MLGAQVDLGDVDAPGAEKAPVSAGLERQRQKLPPAANCTILPLGVVDLLFFFFQAEDGIRDLTVTGVQTCALPISTARGARARGSNFKHKPLQCTGAAVDCSRSRPRPATRPLSPTSRSAAQNAACVDRKSVV